MIRYYIASILPFVYSEGGIDYPYKDIFSLKDFLDKNKIIRSSWRSIPVKYWENDFSPYQKKVLCFTSKDKLENSNLPYGLALKERLWK